MTAFVYAPKLRFQKGSKDMAAKTTGTLQKTPDESMRLECYFVDSETGLPLTIISATVSAADQYGVAEPDMIDFFEIAPEEDGLVFVHIQGGEDRVRYLIKVMAVTTTSKLLEMTLSVKVREAKA